MSYSQTIKGDGYLSLYGRIVLKMVQQRMVTLAGSFAGHKDQLELKAYVGDAKSCKNGACRVEDKTRKRLCELLHYLTYDM